MRVLLVVPPAPGETRVYLDGVRLPGAITDIVVTTDYHERDDWSDGAGILARFLPKPRLRFEVVRSDGRMIFPDVELEYATSDPYDSATIDPENGDLLVDIGTERAAGRGWTVTTREEVVYIEPGDIEVVAVVEGIEAIPRTEPFGCEASLRFGGGPVERMALSGRPRFDPSRIGTSSDEAPGVLLDDLLGDRSARIDSFLEELGEARDGR